MVSTASAEFFLRFVNENQGQLKQSLKGLVNCLIGENKDTKKKLIEDTLYKAEILRDGMSKNDAPSWLTQLIYLLEKAGKGHDDHYQSLIEFLLKRYVEIEQYKWSFQGDDFSFDFDAIYEQYYSQSRLDELFLEVVRILEQIRDSGAIDSLKMFNALEKVISTLKSNTKSSFFSIRSAWEFFKLFFKNYLFVQLGQIPNLGELFEALSETIKETDQEMHDLSDNVHFEMKKRIEGEVQALEGKANFNFLGYNSSGQLENKSSNNSLGRA